MRIVCAPNAFKATLSAGAASEALAEGVRRAGAEPVLAPVADGGDGTLDVLMAAAGTTARIDKVAVSGPLGQAVAARLGWIGDEVAVVELAEAAGLRLLGDTEADPMAATTFGVGELLCAAIDAGARRVVVGVGGSATTDGGMGLLSALGATFRDGQGQPVPACGRGMGLVVEVDLAAAIARTAPVAIEVAVDVDIPLYGDNGAAFVFAAQKGADAAQIAALNVGLENFSTVMEKAIDRPGLAKHPGMGAAGGSAFGLAAIGAAIRSGAQLVCDQSGFDAALRGADLVITGEGRLDDQTRRGKAPAEVARRCQAQGIPCVVIAGEVSDALPDLFSAAHSLGGGAGDPALTSAGLNQTAYNVVTAAMRG